MQKGFAPVLILIGILVIIGIAGGAYYLGKSQTPKPQSLVVSQTPQPVSSPSASPDETANWKTYTGKYVNFKYPADWNPKSLPLSGGATLESVILGIPKVVSDQDLGFSSVETELVKPADAIKEKTITIGGKSGFKWIRKGDNYVSYDYYTKGNQNKGSFGVHVTVAAEDQDLENKLDKLVNSIEFISN